LADAVAIINRFNFRNHSLRYIGDQLAIRLKAKPTPAPVDAFRSGFADMFRPGGDILVCDALPDETDEPAIAHLPRIVVDFNRRDFGRLKSLIDAINVA